MIIRQSIERGTNKIHWLDAKHTFSFGRYYDPHWTNFHNLLVINEDKISPAMGFGTHPHNDMEIITYVISGEIRHEDSMGNTGFIKPGEIQIMSAGTGVAHSEMNNCQDKITHLLQIWVLPSERGLTPRYAQKRVYEEDEFNFLKLIAGDEETQTSIKLNANALMWLGRFNQEETIEFKPKKYKQYWIQMIKGEITVEGQSFGPGDALALVDAQKSSITTSALGAEFLIIEVEELLN